MRRFILMLACVGVMSFGRVAVAATCSAGANCRACKNCSRCKNCSKEGGTCSVCRPDLYSSAGAASGVTTSTPETQYAAVSPYTYASPQTASVETTTTETAGASDAGTMPTTGGEPFLFSLIGAALSGTALFLRRRIR